MLNSEIYKKTENDLIDFWNISFNKKVPSIGWDIYEELKRKIESLIKED